jgi:hypothetical protein
MTTLPRLELNPPHPDFDEAVIVIDGRDEDTITVACDGSRALALAIVRLVNAHNANQPDEQAPYDAGPPYHAYGN